MHVWRLCAGVGPIDQAFGWERRGSGGFPRLQSGGGGLAQGRGGGLCKPVAVLIGLSPLNFLL